MGVLGRVRAEPDHDRGDGDRGVVAVFELVVSGRDGSELLESVEGPFDLVAVLVPLGVEDGWSATTRAAAGTPGQDIIALLDGVRDAPGAQRTPVRLGS